MLEHDDSKRVVSDWRTKRRTVFPIDFEFANVAVDHVKEDMDGHAIDVLDLRLHRNPLHYVGPRRPDGRQGQAALGVDLATSGSGDLERDFVPTGNGAASSASRIWLAVASRGARSSPVHCLNGIGRRLHRQAVSECAPMSPEEAIRESKDLAVGYPGTLTLRTMTDSSIILATVRSS